MAPYNVVNADVWIDQWRKLQITRNCGIVYKLRRHVFLMEYMEYTAGAARNNTSYVKQLLKLENISNVF